jgi:hypothetical protein
MRIMTRIRRVLAITSVVALTIAAPASFAQPATPLAGDTLTRALLEEIRTLRLSLQRNSAYELRGRLLLERARMHQETIRELSREVENSAEVMRPTSVEPMWEETMMADVVTPAPGVVLPDPETRKKMQEREKKMLEYRKAMEAQHREQMRQRLQRMETRLAEERDKLKAIEEELAQMHRELTETARSEVR